MGAERVQPLRDRRRHVRAQGSDMLLGRRIAVEVVTCQPAGAERERRDMLRRLVHADR